MSKFLYAVEALPLILLSAVMLPLQFGITGVLLILILPFCYLGMKFMLSPVMRIISWMVFLVTGNIVHVYGKQNLRKDKNYLIVANHSSYLDVPAIVTFSPAPTWLGKERFLRIPVFGTFLKFIQFIPVYPGNPVKSRDSIHLAISKANRFTIAIFPEGTRTPNGKLLPFKKGFIHILRGSELDLLPITLNGFFNFLPKHRWILNPLMRLEAIIHPPVKHQQLTKMSDDEILEYVSRTIASVYHKQDDWLFPRPSRIAEILRNRRLTMEFVSGERKKPHK